MSAIIVTLQTLQPILATSFQGDPNSDVSYPYIPGSMIRGALISRYLKRNNLQNKDILDENDAKYDEVQKLFFNGNTRYLNAYLFTGKKRTLPVPGSLRKEKGAELPCRIYNLSQIEKPEESLKPLGEDFCTIQGSSVTPYSVERRINIHNLRDRQKGRATQEQGEIFRYEAINAGQTFQAVILCEEGEAKTIQDLLHPTDIWLGGSQSAGYGHTRITQVDSLSNWNEIGVKPDQRSNRTKLTITLLSDMILRDEYGQYVADPILIQNLPELSDAKITRSYVRSTLIGGFNRKWGLPLPQVQALAAGSVLVFEGTTITADQIRNLEWKGLGDRRVEGFGRIAINWLEESKTFQAIAPQNNARLTPVQLSDNSHKLATDMVERLIRQQLDQLLLNEVGRTSIDPADLRNRKITNSQLSRLILVARQALNHEDCNTADIQLMLDNLPSNAAGQFERTRMEGSGKALKQQLEEWISNPRSWIRNPPSVTIADVTVELSDRLAREYTLRLLMAVAKKATKEKQEQSA